MRAAQLSQRTNLLTAAIDKPCQIL